MKCLLLAHLSILKIWSENINEDFFNRFIHFRDISTRISKHKRRFYDDPHRHPRNFKLAEPMSSHNRSLQQIMPANGQLISLILAENASLSLLLYVYCIQLITEPLPWHNYLETRAFFHFSPRAISCPSMR